MGANHLVRRLVRRFVDLVDQQAPPVDFSVEDIALLDRVRPYTLTSPERVFSAASAARFIVDARVPGCHRRVRCLARRQLDGHGIRLAVPGRHRP